MSLSTQNYKGTRDFYPEDMRLRKWMFGKWRDVLESFGYEEYDGPILESMDLFTAKTSEEIVNDQSFNFEDRGGRRVIMRPEMTPTVSRMVAKRRQELGYPLRLYSIPNCFRYERQQRGRLREFWQLNADIFGVEGIDAEFEIILVIDALMKSFGADNSMYQIKINSRKSLEQILEERGFSKKIANELIRLLDRTDKPEEYKKMLNTFDPEIKLRIEQVLKSFAAVPSSDRKTILETQAGRDLSKLIDKLLYFGVDVSLDFSIARGFDYYTDIVFEVFDKNPENNRSMFGGGRYDGLVGEFGVEPVPTVGFGMGDVTFQNFLESNGLIPDLATETDLYIAPVGDVTSQCQELAQQLRGKKLKVAVDLSGKKLDKQIKTADKKGVKNVLFVGEEELNSGKFKLKDIKSGKEVVASLEELVKILS